MVSKIQDLVYWSKKKGGKFKKKLFRYNFVGEMLSICETGIKKEIGNQFT